MAISFATGDQHRSPPIAAHPPEVLLSSGSRPHRQLLHGLGEAMLAGLAFEQASAATGDKPQPVALADIARLAVADAAPSAQAHRINLGLGHVDEGDIAGHAEALRILVGNLVDNAVKYTPSQGTVDVEIHRASDRLVLSVDDTGPGIAEEDRERVLDRFYRVAGKETIGSGLGLAIVKSIAELHGAAFSLDRSQRLGGLRVEVVFPSDAAPPPRSRLITSLPNGTERQAGSR